MSATIYDIYLKVQSQDNTDPNVFMIQILPKNALDQYQTQFSHVASPVDMQSYPAQYNRDYPYYRTDKFVLRVGSQYQKQQLLKGLARGVRRLDKALAMLQQSDDLPFIDGTDLV